MFDLLTKSIAAAKMTESETSCNECYVLQRERLVMPVEVNGIRYFSATEIAERIGVSRQTLWRWRNQDNIPAGARYRDRQIFFSEEDLQQILDYAHRMEPVRSREPKQLRLF